MNLREKFIWNFLITISSLSIIWTSWSLYNNNFATNKLFENFKNEQVGTDKELNNKVNKLEDIYTYRNNMKFRTKRNPFDLTRVIASDDAKGRKSNLWISGILKDPDGSHIAWLNYKNKSYKVVKGDSIGGGVINDITSTEVVYKKNDKIQYFNLGVDNNIE